MLKPVVPKRLQLFAILSTCRKKIRKIYKKFGTYFYNLTTQQILQEVQFNQQIFEDLFSMFTVY